MRLLFIHSDHLEFEAEEPVDDDLAENDGVPHEGRMENCATVFTTVEADDGDTRDATLTEAVEEVRATTDKLGTNSVVIYPYAHLADDLAPADTATDILVEFEERLTDGGYDVLRAPFGWYKSFEVSCKGHPLSELSRHIAPEADDSSDDGGAEAEASETESEWRVIHPDGKHENARAAKASVSSEMEAFIEAEVEDVDHAPGEEPPHVELMREKGIADYDDLSDAGNLRFLPRGKMIRDALIEYVNNLVVDYGGMPVETPVMYDLDAAAISTHADKFGERQYRFDSGNRRMMLRFAACFGQFSIMRDMHISESDLPLRVYEMSTYSFRREDHGAVTGLKRLRAFTMPDMHTATEDMEQAREELRRQAQLALEAGDDLGLNYQPALRVTRAFHKENRDWIEDVVAELDRPTLVEVLPDRHHYWSAKIDFAVIDGLGRPIENPTVQIDVESGERFDIEYHDGDEKHHPPVLHYSPSGGIERVMAALLEEADEMDTPRLPTWLSPSQVRLIPVAPDTHLDFCRDVADTLEDAGIRVDIDEREESVGRRVARAEEDWVPYYAVIGDDEAVDGGDLSVTVRGGEDLECAARELREHVRSDIEGLPSTKLYLPRRLSRRPSFSG